MIEKIRLPKNDLIIQARRHTPGSITLTASCSEIDGVKSVHLDCSHGNSAFGHVYKEDLASLISFLKKAQRWIDEAK